MSMTSLKSLSLGARAVAVAVGLFVTSGAALGSPIQVRDGNGGNVFNGGPGHVNLTINLDGSNRNVAAGAFALEYRQTSSNPWVSFLTYCLEPDENLGINSNGTPVSGNLNGSMAGTSEYASRASAIAGLWNTWFLDSLTSATRSAAFQVALWELAYDAGSSLATGVFRYTASGAVKTQALAYLNPSNWNNPIGATPGVILRTGNQDLVVNIPEPATLALFGLGLIGLAAAGRRRAARS